MDHHEDSDRGGPPWTFVKQEKWEPRGNSSEAPIVVAARKVGHSEKVSGPRGCLGCLASGTGSGHHVGLVKAGFWRKIEGFWMILASKAWNTCETMGILMQNLTMQNMGWSHEQMGISPEIQAETWQNYAGLLLNGITLTFLHNV